MTLPMSMPLQQSTTTTEPHTSVTPANLMTHQSAATSDANQPPSQKATITAHPQSLPLWPVCQPATIAWNPINEKTTLSHHQYPLSPETHLQLKTASNMPQPVAHNPQPKPFQATPAQNPHKPTGESANSGGHNFLPAANNHQQSSQPTSQSSSPHTPQPPKQSQRSIPPHHLSDTPQHLHHDQHQHPRKIPTSTNLWLMPTPPFSVPPPHPQNKSPGQTPTLSTLLPSCTPPIPPNNFQPL